MEFEDQLSDHLKTQASHLDVPARSLTLSSQGEDRQVPSGLAVAAAITLVVGLGYGLLSAQPTPEGTQEFPDLKTVAELNPTLSTLAVVSPLDDFEWSTLDVSGANLLDFLRVNVAVAEDSLAILSPDGSLVGTELVPANAEWNHVASDGDTLWIIELSDAGYSVLTTSDGAEWTRAPIEFPLDHGNFELVGATGDRAVVSYRQDRYPGDDFRRLIPEEYQQADYQYFPTASGVCVIEGTAGLMVDKLEYQELGPDMLSYDELPSIATTPETHLVGIDVDGLATNIEVPIDNASFWYPSNAPADGFVSTSYGTSQESFFTTDGDLWVAVPAGFENLDVHNSVVYAATDNRTPRGAFRLIGDDWVPISPPELYSRDFHLEQFDVDNLGAALIVASDTEYQLNAGPLQWTHGNAALRLNYDSETLTISAGGTSVTYPFFCPLGVMEPSGVRIAADGDIVFTDPTTNQVLLESDIDEFQKEVQDNLRFTVEAPQRFLFFSIDEQEWFSLDITELIGHQDITDLYVTDRLLLIATEDRLLVGTPPGSIR